MFSNCFILEIVLKNNYQTGAEKLFLKYSFNTCLHNYFFKIVIEKQIKTIFCYERCFLFFFSSKYCFKKYLPNIP